jgi:predicted AlkP superfamily phosphohydrolase/phosphomutase
VTLRTESRFSRIALTAGLLLAFSSIPAGARAAEKPRTRMLVVGVDAGEWDILGPLMEQGRCPNFARIRATGSAGRLRSLLPLTRSPVIWASIATGKVPEKHGIQDFFARRIGGEIEQAPAEDQQRPITSNLWKARPVWNILGALNRTVGVVGWWTTWPARPVNGVLVSDYVQYEPKWADGGSRLTYPDSLGPMVQRLRRTPQSVSWSELSQFVAPFDTTQVTERQKEILRTLRTIYAGDMTLYRAGLALYKEKRPDFFTIYFRGVDEVSHRYWDLDGPGRFDPPLTKAEIAWLKPLIPNYYIFTDRLLGEFLRIAGKDTDVIVCSDHGFGGGGIGVMAHKPDGIIFMTGPHMVKGGTITGATVLDITPTILATFGLPTARDMDGRPIQGGLLPRIVKRIERDTRLPTYETARGEGKSEEPLRSPVDDELRERLRSLGYIQ